MTQQIETQRVAVRHLTPGDILVGGVTISRVWSGSKTRKGYKTVEMVKNGKRQVTEWNASTTVHVTNR